MSIQRIFQREKIIDQLSGLALGVAVAAGLAVGIEVYDAVKEAPDAALLDLGFWKTVGAGALVTGIRSGVSALGTVLGLNIRGVSSA